MINERTAFLKSYKLVTKALLNSPPNNFFRLLFYLLFFQYNFQYFLLNYLKISYVLLTNVIKKDFQLCLMIVQVN